MSDFCFLLLSRPISASQRFSLSALTWVLSALCLPLFVGCSPSLDEARQVLQQRITTQSQGHIKLVSFRKTDLQEFQVKGVPGRRLRYAAEVEFAHRGIWSGWAGMECLSFEFSPNDRSEQGNVAEIIDDLRGNRQMYEGDRIRIAGVMTGTKSDQHWRYDLDEIHLAGD
jgi:hypothetical protein